jgi:TolA-binding protein
MSATSRLAFLALLGAPLPAMAAPQVVAADPQEWAVFRDTLERYSERMRELQDDVKEILAAQEAEERSKVSGSYGAAIRRTEDAETSLRRVAIQRLEAFLQKYPTSEHAPDMLFRLADLYFEESELAFNARMDEYGRVEAQLAQNPNLVLPEPPNKDYSKSVRMYNEVIRKFPNYAFLADTHYMLAWCLSVTNSEQYDPDAARDVYQTIVDRFPGSAFANDANMRLGEYYFDLPGTRANPTVHKSTAIRYYEAVLRDGPSGRNYDESIYKLGWTHYQINDYDRALAYLVQLLDYSDQQFLQTGRESNMRQEAVQYLAISYADIAERGGRRAIEVAAEHLGQVGDRKWQHDVVEYLADILWQQARWEASIDAYAYLQERWPDHPTNPIYQRNIALIWAGSPQNAFTPPQARPPMPFPDLAKSGQAFARLATDYVDGTRWAEANRNNPDAIGAARKFIEKSLSTVATERLIKARETGSVEDYREAARQYTEFLDKFPFADEYDTFEWYRALALFQSNQFAAADAAYTQILKNDQSPFRDGARFQIMKTREQIVLAKFGKLEEIPADAVVESTVDTPFGKQITRYMISDEHKSFIAACDDLVEREFTDPEWAPALERDRAAFAYLPAQILYEHGHYAEARARFEKVMARFPTKNEAMYSAGLYMNTFTNEGDLASVAKFGQQFATKNFGEDPDLAALKKAEFRDAVERSSFMLAYELIQKGDRAGAAQAYVDFMRQYPSSALYKDALYNAANNFELVGKAEESNRLFEQYITKYPSDDRSKNLYFRIAQNYSSTLDLQKAVQYYETLVKLFPDFVDSPAALYNAAFLRVGMGDHAGAAKGYERYATAYANQPDAEQAFWSAGEQWEAVGEADALDFYQRYVKRFPSADPNHLVQAHYEIATIYTKRGDARRAGQAWGAIQQAFAASDPSRLSQRTRSIAAEGALSGLQKRYEAFTQIKWTNSEEKNVVLLTQTKPEELKALTDEAVRLIQTYQDFDTAAASLYYQGVAYYAYAKMAYEIPPPPGLSDEEIDVYRMTIDESFRIPSEDKGRARLAASLEKARAEKRWSIWNTRAMEALHDNHPLDFPSERVESRGAAAGGGVEFAGPESLTMPTGGSAAAPDAPAGGSQP